MPILARFVKGQSDLLKVDMLLLFAFLRKNSIFLEAEMQGAKTKSYALILIYILLEKDRIIKKKT